MKHASTTRSVRLVLDELEMRWQPAFLGLGLDLPVAAAHVPNILPATSALVRADLAGTSNNTATPAATTPTASSSNAEDHAATISVTVPSVVLQETQITVGQFVATEVRPVGVTFVTFTIFLPAAIATSGSSIHLASGTTAGSTGIGTIDRTVASSLPTTVGSSPSGSVFSIGLNLSAATTTPSSFTALGSPGSTIGNSPFTPTESTAVRTITSGDIGKPATTASLNSEMAQPLLQWYPLAPDPAADTGVSKPAQPSADAKPEPITNQPPAMIDPEPMPSEPTAADIVPAAAALGETVVPIQTTIAAAGIVPLVDEDGPSYRTWLGAAVAVMTAASGYPLYRWYRQQIRDRQKLLLRAKPV